NMVTKQELHQARKNLLDAGASLVFQGKGVLHVDYLGSKSPYDSTDTELALLKEILTSKDYSDLNKRLKEGKDKILQDPFFTSLKTRTTEEQKHFFKRIEYWYNEKSGLGDVYGLPHCIESVKRTTENTKSNGELAVNIFQLKNDFLKMNEFDKSFGDKIDKDSLKKIKDRLDSLTDDKTKLDNQLTTANDTIISLNDTITTLTTQLGERNDTIDNRD
ncbi:13610_t:CDS:2, partial [Racocetra persica]